MTKTNFSGIAFAVLIMVLPPARVARHKQSETVFQAIVNRLAARAV